MEKRLVVNDYNRKEMQKNIELILNLVAQDML